MDGLRDVVENGEDFHPSRLGSVIDGVREPRDGRFTDVGQGERVEIRVRSDPIENFLHLIDELYAATRPLSFVIVERLVELALGDVAKDDRHAHR
jgi:hypothetical protein